MQTEKVFKTRRNLNSRYWRVWVLRSLRIQVRVLPGFTIADTGIFGLYRYSDKNFCLSLIYFSGKFNRKNHTAFITSELNVLYFLVKIWSNSKITRSALTNVAVKNDKFIRTFYQSHSWQPMVQDRCLCCFIFRARKHVETASDASNYTMGIFNATPTPRRIHQLLLSQQAAISEIGVNQLGSSDDFCSCHEFNSPHA